MSTSPSPLIDMAREIHDKFTKFMSYIPGGESSPSEHDKAVADVNKQAMDKSVQDANASHVLSEQQAAKIRAKMGK
jgi:hypothetical protein